MLKLLILQGPDKGRMIELRREAAIVGREKADIILHDYTVSRQHARLFHQDGRWFLEDLESANGTSLNGLKLNRTTMIKPGDQFRVGCTVMVCRSVLEPNASVTLTASSDGLRLGNLLTTSDDRMLACWSEVEESVILATQENTQAAENLRVLYRLSAAVSSLYSVPQLLEQMLNILFDNLPVAHGIVFLYQGEGEELSPAAWRVRQEGKQPIQVPREILFRALKEENGVLIKNVGTERQLREHPALRELDIRTILCVPIKARESLLGALYLDGTGTDEWNEPQRQLVNAIGLQTGLAIENARLFDETLKAERVNAVGEAVASLSHYVKNVLLGLRIATDVVNMGLQAGNLAMIRQGWQVVGRNTEKIYDLMLNLLAYSKDREPRYELVDINALVREVLELGQPRAQDKGVQLQAKLAPRLPRIQADPVGLHHALLNLVVNALEAAPPERGMATLRTGFDSRKNEVEIQVHDNGPGIPPEVQKRLFTPFFSSKGQSGTGLGLAVARKLVEEHKGKIELSSNPQRGTTFRVLLPAASFNQNGEGKTTA